MTLKSFGNDHEREKLHGWKGHWKEERRNRHSTLDVNVAKGNIESRPLKKT